MNSGAGCGGKICFTLCYFKFVYYTTLYTVLNLPRIVYKPVITRSAAMDKYISQPSASCMNKAPAKMLT